MGRQRRAHLIPAAQHATTNALGGSEIREQLGLRLMGQATTKAWAMLAPEIAHPPVGDKPRGRWHIVRGGQAIEFQGGLWTPDEIRAYATSGCQVAWSHGRENVGVLGNPARPVTRCPQGEAPAAAESGGRLVTIKDASANEGRGLVPLSHHMLRKLRQNDPAFPQPVERATRKGQPHAYDAAELAAYVTEWAASHGRQPKELAR